MPADKVAQRLATLADEFGLALGAAAVVTRADLRQSQAGALQTTITPRRPDALPVAWLDFGTDLQVQAGHNADGGS